jgi:site-specific DNA recombinase
MPELRIVPQELWDAVQARQAEIRKKSVALREALNNPQSRSHAGKYLFSGLLKCGCCGANFTMCSTHSYGCAVNLNRGDAACSNRLRLPRRIVELRLMEAVQHELFSDEAVDLFIQETTMLLKQQEASRPNQDSLKRSLDRAEREVANIMAAIKAGVVTPSTKAELERAEAERTRLEEALKSDAGTPDKLTSFLPDVKRRYRSLLEGLGKALMRDIAEARESLKTLLGAVRLIPQPGGYLAAELQQSFDGLVKLLGGEGLKVCMVAGTRSVSNLLDPSDQGLKACMVAGAGFEPATFRL